MATSSTRRAAIEHLAIVKKNRKRQAEDERLYVRLSYTYGLTVPEIADESGISVEAIRLMLTGSDG
jgi:DNA-directed RNA polymerase specialized sigma24 family protein